MGLWADIKNHKLFLDWLGSRLGFTSREDWYNLRYKQVHDNYGGGLLAHYYNNSPSVMVRTIYTDYDFLPWKFAKAPEYLGKDEEALKEILRHVENKYNIASIDDWRRISRDELKELDVLYWIQKAGGLPHALKILYPDHHWQFEDSKM